MAKLMPFLEAQQIYPRGRYGSWTYNSMEDCLMLGREVASLLETGSRPARLPRMRRSDVGSRVCFYVR